MNTVLHSDLAFRLAFALPHTFYTDVYTPLHLAPHTAPRTAFYTWIVYAHAFAFYPRLLHHIYGCDLDGCLRYGYGPYHCPLPLRCASWMVGAGGLPHWATRTTGHSVLPVPVVDYAHVTALWGYTPITDSLPHPPPPPSAFAPPAALPCAGPRYASPPAAPALFALHARTATPRFAPHALFVYPDMPRRDAACYHLTRLPHPRFYSTPDYLPDVIQRRRTGHPTTGRCRTLPGSACLLYMSHSCFTRVWDPPGLTADLPVDMFLQLPFSRP